MSYSDGTRNLINNIAHILHISTTQPHLQVLPLTPILPQTQSKNIQLQNILSIPVPALRVEPVLQPPGIQTFQSAPIPTPRLKPSTSPSLDPHQNPGIENFTKYLKSPQIPKAGKTQVAPRKVQHRLRRSLRSSRMFFRKQAAHHLVVNHIFNLPHAFHIYNKQGKRRL